MALIIRLHSPTTVTIRGVGVDEKEAEVVPLSEHQFRCAQATSVADGVPQMIRDMLTLRPQIQPIPLQTKIQLYGYQVEGVKQMLAWRGRGILADDMGLGKTRQSLAVVDSLMQHEKRPLHVLILMPASLKDNWCSEISNLLPEYKVSMFKRAKDEFEFIEGENTIYLMSYALITQKYKVEGRVVTVKDKCLAQTWDVVLCDESHRVKSPMAQSTKLAMKLCAKAKYVLLMTGTPMNRPRDLWTQIKCVDPKAFHDGAMFPWVSDASKFVEKKWHSPKLTFGDRYCAPRVKYARGGRPIMDLGGAAHLDELNVVIRHLYLIHRQKAHVLHGLTKKYRERLVISKNLVEFKMPENAPLDYVMRQVEAHSLAKWPSVEKYLVDVIVPLLKENPDRKLITFSFYHNHLDGTKQVFEKNGIKCVQVDGRTKHKQATIDEFQRSGDIQVGVMSIAAAGVGFNMAFVNWVVFTEMRFSPDEHLQAEDRCWRNGQTQDVVCQYLVVDNSVDELLWGMINKKHKNISQTLLGEAKQLPAKRVKLNDSVK